MPIQDRKFYIMKHNNEQEEHKQSMNSDKNGSYITGEGINTYASLEQQNKKNRNK